MTIMQTTSRITRREPVTGPVLALCKSHSVLPHLFNIYTGKKKNRFQGTTCECPMHSDCTVFSYDVKDAAEKWNRINS